MNNNIKYSEFNESFDIEYRNKVANGPIHPHIHNSAEIYLNLSSLPGVLLGTKVTTALPNTLIIFPSFCVHQLFTTANERYERYIISVDVSWLDSLLTHCKSKCEYLKNTEQPLMLPLNDTECLNLQYNFDEFLFIKEKNSFSALACFINCMYLIDEIMQSVDEQTSKKEPIMSITQRSVNEIIAYINKHITETITLSDLSQHFYLNQDYISRIFKEHTHTAISNYITLQKIAKAQILLREGHTVTQVQIMTGYSSYSYFFRTFKKRVGMTPSKYRDHFLQNF